MAGDNPKQGTGWPEEHGRTASTLSDVTSVDPLPNAIDKPTRKMGTARDDNSSMWSLKL